MDLLCKTCGTAKPDSEFYAGMKSCCKRCYSARIAAAAMKRAEAREAAGMQRWPRKLIDEYTPVEADRLREASRERQRRIRSVGVDKRVVARELRDPKQIAHDITKNAIARGDLIKGPCETCGAEPAQAHHPDYSKPLDVMWLCPKHHRRLHVQLRRLCAKRAA